MASTEQFQKQAASIPFTKNILRGRIYCGCCGKRMSRVRYSKGYSYYCVSNIEIAKGTCVEKMYLTERDLFQMIIEVIQREAETITGNRMKLESRRHKIVSERDSADKEIAKLRQSVENNKGFQAGLYENFVSGVLTKAEYLEMKEDYRKKIIDAVEQVRKIQEYQQELEKQMQEYIILSDEFAKVNADTTLTGKMVDQMIERVVVNSPRDISVDFRFENNFGRLMEVLLND